jgi:hypothetical protein
MTELNLPNEPIHRVSAESLRGLALTVESKGYGKAFEELEGLAPVVNSTLPLTYDTLMAAIMKVEGHKITHIVLASDSIGMLLLPEFADYFDPVTKLDEIHTGRMGTIFGMKVVTDAYFHPALRFLKTWRWALFSVEKSNGDRA